MEIYYEFVFCNLMLTRGWNFQRHGVDTQQFRHNRLSLRLLLNFFCNLWGRISASTRFFGLLRVFVNQGIKETFRLIGASFITILYHQREVVCGCVFLVLDLQHLLQAFGFRRFLGPLQSQKSIRPISMKSRWLFTVRLESGLIRAFSLNW